MLSVRVTQKKQEALEVCSFELRSLDGAALPAFEPGAHIDVHVNGVVRQYSLYNLPSDPSVYRIAVLRDAESRGGSVAMHDTITQGDILRVGEPRNLFPLVETAGHSILLAGGIGVTPIACMAQHLFSTGSSFSLHYFARSQERAALKDLLQGKLPNEHVHFHFDDEPDSALNLAELLADVRPGTHLYACGPSGFLQFVRSTAIDARFDSEAIHFESFKAASKDVGESKLFQVQIGRGGNLVDVPADSTIAEALQAAGIDIPLSCEQGVCGTCVTGVLDGVPDHRDSFLLPEERNTKITPCCSRCFSPILVLDL